MADEAEVYSSPFKASAWECTEAYRRKANLGTPNLETSKGARLLRAKALGVKLMSETSFEANQSFPRYQKSKHEYNNFNSSRQKLPRVLKADDLHCISFASSVAEPPSSSCHSSIITTGDVSIPSDSWFIREDLDSESFRSHLIHPRKALLTINLRSMKILTTNDIALELLQYTAEDFERLSLDDLIAGEKGQPAIAETLLFGNEDSVIHSGKVVTVLRKNGTHLAMSLWLSRINQPDCEDLCIAALEPVERIIAQLDVDCEGRIVVGNNAAAALFHYDCNDLSGRHLTCLLPKATIPPFKDAMTIQQTVGVTYHGQHFPLSLQFKSSDEMVYDEENESILEWVAHTAIITVYAHFSGLFIINDGGYIVDVNTCFLLLAFGYDRQDILGKKLADFMSPFDKKFVTAAEFLHRDGSSVPVNYEMRKSYETNDGNRHCVWISCSLRHLQNWDESQPYFASESSVSGFNEVSLGNAVAHKAHQESVPLHLIHSCNCSVTADDDVAMTQGEYGTCYELVRDIGRGGFGCVKLAFRKTDRLLVVTKFLRKCRISHTAFVKSKHFMNEQLPLEIHLLMTLKHPHIVALLDVFENEDYYQIAMEKHGSGYDLFEFVERKPALNEPLASYIFRQLVSAIDYLHSINIVHRDIKDENVIINHEFHIKLIDFGAAAYFEPGRKFTTFFGTEQFGCPEALRGRGYIGPEAEVWALGVTLYVLMYEELPFGNVDESIAAVLQPPYEQSEELMALLHKMLRREPGERITVPELKAHSWLNQAVDCSGYDFYEMMRQKPPSRDISVFYQTPKRSKAAADLFKVPAAAASTDANPLVVNSCLLPVTSTPCRKERDSTEEESLSVAGDSFLTSPDFDDEGEV